MKNNDIKIPSIYLILMLSINMPAQNTNLSATVEYLKPVFGLKKLDF